MRKGIFLLLSVFVLLGIGLTGVAAAQTAANETHVRKIVVFRSEDADDASHTATVERHGGGLAKHLRLINAAAVHVPPSEAAALAVEPNVLRVDDDIVVKAIPDPETGSTRPARGAIEPAAGRQPAQRVSWGMARIHAPAAWKTTTAPAVKVATLDTGVDLTHPDLIDNIKGGANILSPISPPQDDNGHGTHVAGILAAEKNKIGVVGVGPNVDLYAVKVLGATGNGMVSDIISGLEWCIANHIQVVNMSFGTQEDSPSFREAITQAHNAGIVEVAAAGNDGPGGDTVEFPGRYPEVIAVSALTPSNHVALFSSVGPEVALTAPGVNVRSCYLGGGYAILSGTSMSSPFAAGVAALVISTPVGASDTNGNGVWDPDEVRARLTGTAHHFILSADKEGAGLVRADLAVK
jgi:subtilisin family serine protease